MAKKTLKPFRFHAAVMVFAKDADDALARFDKALDTIGTSDVADRWISAAPIEVERRSEDQLYAPALGKEPKFRKPAKKAKKKAKR